MCTFLTVTIYIHVSPISNVMSKEAELPNFKIDQ